MRLDLFMNNIKLFFKSNITYFLTIFIILLFPISAYFLLVKKELITEEAFYGNLLVFAGWIIALLIAWINIRKNREDNIIIQNNEIRKRLEIEAFKEVNKMIEEVNLALSEIGAYYGYELIKELSSNEDSLFLSKLQSYTQFNKKMEDKLLMLWIKYKLKIRSHEIALLQFNDLKNKIDLKFKDSVLFASEFGKYIQTIKTKNSLTSNELLEIKNKCIKIDKCFSILGKGLTEYGLELQNEMLGGIFKSKVPKPQDRETRRTFSQIISKVYKQDK